MGAEIRVQITLAGTGKSIEDRCEDLIREQVRSMKFCDVTDIYPMGTGVMEAEFECIPVSDWGDVKDNFSSSGTRGGLVETYEPARAEIETVMKELYLNDIADDWEFLNELPEDKAA